uniref:Uncharacterized protein n=1 Tax=Romanomermis culicivorax TaxID=13658 RepID=A0A915JEQ3_ROMCU
MIGAAIHERMGTANDTMQKNFKNKKSIVKAFCTPFGQHNALSEFILIGLCNRPEQNKLDSELNKTNELIKCQNAHPELPIVLLNVLLNDTAGVIQRPKGTQSPFGFNARPTGQTQAGGPQIKGHIFGNLPPLTSAQVT